jgi:hypothetical protein
MPSVANSHECRALHSARRCGEDLTTNAMSVPPFESSSLTTIAKILGDTKDGLTGDEIGQLASRVR